MRRVASFILIASVALAACDGSDTPAGSDATAGEPTTLTESGIENLVRRSYQYVAMFNVNNKFAALQGWNRCLADTTLKDHTMRDIARPNNDTLYTSCMLDLSQDAIVLKIPAFDSDYASLMITGYDHYVNVPLASRLGDFEEPETLLVYSARTPGYDGEPIEGIDHVFEATGDFVSAVFRVMPHATDRERFERIIAQKQSIEAVPLAEFRGEAARPHSPPVMPAVGETDADVFGTNLIEVMQFVFDHTTFDPDNELDREILALYAPLGVVPGEPTDGTAAASLDGAAVRAAAERIRDEWLASLADPSTMAALESRIFQPKGRGDLEALLAVSIIGPIGIPQEEVVYPQVATTDGEPMNALHDYVIRMSKDELPPARAFWSVTLYDRDQGFFIPNDRKKYSVGANAGMKLDEDGGIAIYIAAQKPEGVPVENWLPIERRDVALSAQLRLYGPDLERYATWTPPRAEKL